MSEATATGGADPGASGTVDKGRVEAFGQRMLEILNGGALTLAVSTGHRAGLFDTLADLEGATAAGIAEAADLDERYVREWLAAVVTGGIVDYEPRDRTYRLPPEHAALLTRRASPHNLAVTAQYIPILAEFEEDILECFRRGGGVPYERFRRFHEVVAEDGRQSVVLGLFDAILPLSPGLEDRLRQGIDVLDVGCGEARAMVALASAYPNSRFRGVDTSRAAVDAGRRQAAELGLRNMTLEVRDPETVRERRRYDLVTAFDSIHVQPRPDAVLRVIRRTLRRDGVFFMQNVATSSRLEDNLDHPVGPFLYTVSYNHCMTVSLAEDGAGVGLCWGRELAERMLRDAGFRSVERHQLPHDLLNDFFVVRG